MQRYVKRLEHYSRAYPFNWFNFFDVWEGAAPSGGGRQGAAGMRRASGRIALVRCVAGGAPRLSLAWPSTAARGAQPAPAAPPAARAPPAPARRRS